MLNARRSAGTICSGRLTISECLVMCWKFSVELKAGLMNEPPPLGNTISGTPSDQHCATAPNAFSMPGPSWQANTPTLSPEDRRLMASAMWMPMRSWRTTMGRMSTSAHAFGEGIQGIGEEEFHPFPLEDLCRDLTDVHRIPLFALTGDGIKYPFARGFTILLA